MNRKKVFNIVGRINIINSALMLIPLIVSIIFKEKCVISFIAAASLSLIFGLFLILITKTKNNVIYAKEGFAIVVLTWVTMSLFGALPFYISGEIPSYVDSFFETVSGFTTTGASILTDVESMSKGLLFWRSFTHWIGGMGVLVFVMAFLPNISDRSIHILRAEMPGPTVDKLVPRSRDTAKILYMMYIVLTVVEIVLLLCGGMPFYDSLVHTFGTAGTGGFGIKSSSIAGYNSYLQWVITIFMFLFGINFNLYYLLVLKRIKYVFKSSELWVYTGIVLVSIGIITADIYSMTSGFSEALRLSSFQVSSVITTTGFSTTDFNLWPTLSKSVLLVLMFIGACAGSTGGGLKVSRVIMLVKLIFKEIKQMIHPRSVSSMRFEGKDVEDKTQRSVSVYFAVYMICFFVIFLIISIESFDFETTFSAVTACFNNIGPGFGVVGPTGSFAPFSDFSTLVLSIAMLLGRLEIFPLLIVLTPSVWMKK